MYNVVGVCGRIVNNFLELKETVNKVPFLRFTIVTNTFRSSGATYINCIAWRQSATNMHRFLQKGSLVIVEGRLQSDINQNLEVSVNFVYFLEKANVDLRGQSNNKQTVPETANEHTQSSVNNFVADEKKPSVSSFLNKKKTQKEQADLKSTRNVLEKEKDKGIDWDVE